MLTYDIEHIVIVEAALADGMPEARNLWFTCAILTSNWLASF